MVWDADYLHQLRWKSHGVIANLLVPKFGLTEHFIAQRFLQDHATFYTHGWRGVKGLGMWYLHTGSTWTLLVISQLVSVSPEKSRTQNKIRFCTLEGVSS